MAARKTRTVAGAAASPKPDPSTFTGLYGVAVVGDCMAPEYPHGSLAKVSPQEPFARGDVVVVWHRPDLVGPGRAPGMIKRIAMMPPPWVKGYPHKDNPKDDVVAVIMLGRDDRPNEIFAVPCSEIVAIHKCIGILKPQDVSKDFRPAADRGRAPKRAQLQAVPA